MASVPWYIQLLTLILTSFLIHSARCDPVEGSRLLEEAFRDYDKRIRPSFGGSPVLVNVSIYILSVAEVDTSRMTYKASFFIRQIWNDARLSFNSRRNIDTITLSGTQSERIWTPDTYFVNELSSVAHETLVKNQFCRISQDGMVLLSRRVTLTLFSPMKLNFFPYDSHQLILEMESYGSQSKDLKYIWTNDVGYSSKSPPAFSMTGFSTWDSSKTTDTGSYSSLTIEINVRREPLSYEIGVMLPTAILAILSLTGLHLRSSTVGAGISTLSILATIILYGQALLSNQGPNGLPYFTPLHLYILLSIGFNVLCLVLITKGKRHSARVASLRDSDHPKNSRTESTSEEECRHEEPKSDGIPLPQENCECPMSLVTDTNTEKSSCPLRKLGNRLFRNGPEKSRSERHSCLLVILWSIYITGNIVFFVVFRCVQLLF